MIETKQMTAKDFLEIMKANAKEYPEFDALPDELKERLANLNICTGTAESTFEDGKLIGVFGIRYMGIGEVWGISMPELREKRKFFLLKQAKKSFKETCEKLDLIKVSANSIISDNFLIHLGLVHTETNKVWIRKP